MNRAHRNLLLQTLLVFGVALLPRLVGTGQFITADEKQWVGRGVEFVRALREFRFNDTLQTTHPGIPTLWISGLTSSIVARLSHQPFSFDALLPFLVASRLPIAVLNSLLVASLFFAARTLVGPGVALLGALTIALDPFLIGHSKIVHVDALLAGFTALSLLLLLRAERGLHTRAETWALPASAVAGALAILSKIPGLILVPLSAVILFSSRTAWRTGERRERLRLYGQWLIIVTATILLLWPGLLWVPDPLGNVKTVKRDLLVALETPHHMADEYSLNSLQYPAALLARSTVPTLMGFLLFVVLLLMATVRTVRRRRRATEIVSPGDTRAEWLRAISLHTAWILFGFIVLFIFGMMFGAKKGDRYILPVFVILDLLAAVGLWTGITLLRPTWSVGRATKVAGVLLLAPLTFEVVRLGPYTLAHFNPLFPHNLSQELGWGEGLDQVAHFLNREADQKSYVASWYPEELRALVRRPVFHLNAHEQLPVGYVVLYRNMFGRALDHPANDFLDEYYRKQVPVFIAAVNGLPYAWVYRKASYRSIVGEITPEKTLVAELPALGQPLSGIEIFLATYVGRANVGDLVLRVRASVTGTDLSSARSQIYPDQDNRWVRIFFDQPLNGYEQSTLVVLLTTEGTKDGNAPTIRLAPEYRPAPAYALTSELSLPSDILIKKKDRGLLGVRAIGDREKRGGDAERGGPS